MSNYVVTNDTNFAKSTINQEKNGFTYVVTNDREFAKSVYKDMCSNQPISTNKTTKIKATNRIFDVKDWLKNNKGVKNSKDIINGVDNMTAEDWKKTQPNMKNNPNIEITGSRFSTTYEFKL